MNNHRYSDDLLDRTIETYQPHYARELTRADAQEILSNMVNFFRQLHALDLETVRQGRLNVMPAASRPSRQKGSRKRPLP